MMVMNSCLNVSLKINNICATRYLAKLYLATFKKKLPSQFKHVHMHALAHVHTDVCTNTTCTQRHTCTYTCICKIYYDISKNIGNMKPSKVKN